MILLKVPFKWKRPVAEDYCQVYTTNFQPTVPYLHGDLRMLNDRVYGTWDYKPPWPYSGVTDFTEYKNVTFLESGGMVMWVDKKEGERYTGARMSTMRHTGKCKGWVDFRMEAELELPVRPYVVAAWWLLTETHLQEKPIWSEEFQKWENKRITPEIDWPETSTQNIANEAMFFDQKFNMACHYGLTHYEPYSRQKNAQFPQVVGRHIWFIEKQGNWVYLGLDGIVKYVLYGKFPLQKMYPIFWITVPDWAPLGYDPEQANMKVYSFKVFQKDG